MKNIRVLDKKYSTTRLLTKTIPTITNKPEYLLHTQLSVPDNPHRIAEGGLRTQGYLKSNNTDTPLISIVTVVFNGVDYLEDTIKSVINQSYSNIEYIIIDGGSTDGTLDIIKKYTQQIDYWMSESDEGIYDAMNKGTTLATGEWLNFMNAGDWFYSNKVVNLIGAEQTNANYIYGDHELRYPTFNILHKALPLSEIWKGMVFSHQSLFVQRTLMLKSPFEIHKLKVSSDYQFITSLVNNSQLKTKYIDAPLSSVDMQGYSVNNVKLNIIENYQIIKKYNNSLLIKFYYLYKYTLAIPKELLKRKLPITYVDMIRKFLKNE